jgi:uncharacterized protein (TIRG00374 family)
MIVMMGGLLWYVGFAKLGIALSQVNPAYLLLAFLAYFVINVLFTFRIIRVLKRQGIKANFSKTILAQYGGMLSSDVTPGRSGYMLTPVYLKDQNITVSAGISCILGIQSIEFLVKVTGGIMAIIFLLYETHLTHEVFALVSAGVGLMLFGGLVLAAIVWSSTAASFIRKVAGSKPIIRYISRFVMKLETFEENALKIRNAIPQIALISLFSWIAKGFEWYFLGLAIGITSIGWLGFFLLHPLITAMAFIPLTPSGIGFQEGAIVGIFILLGVNVQTALVFALLSRALLVIEDLIGLPQIARSTQHGIRTRVRQVV